MGEDLPQQPRISLPQVRGRAAQSNPANRFEKLHLTADFEDLGDDNEAIEALRKIRTEYYLDDSASVISENQSPDIPFRYSLNPYRGCAHGCSYCYARPTHEYLGFSAGLDFESKIMVKPNAPQLLRAHLSKRNWQVEPIMLSGVTDCYQPAEREFRITRQCLEVAAEFRQPIHLITKNALVTRDIDIIASMAAQNLARVAVSITSLDQSLTRKMEPRTSSPAARLRAVSELSEAGIPVTVMLAPIIPGLNDSEMPSILEAAHGCGASFAGYILLRLPTSVRPVFLEWLANNVPDQQSKIESLIKQTRDGELNQSEFGKRMRGSGVFADHLANTFKLFARKYGLDKKPLPLDRSEFTVPSKSGQLPLF